MSETRIDLDDEFPAEAARIPGTTTEKDTVNSALPEVVLRVKRLEALEKLGRRAERGEFDAAIAARDAERRARRRSGS